MMPFDYSIDGFWLSDMIEWLWAIEDLMNWPPIIGEYNEDGKFEFMHEWHQSICEGLHDPSCR